MFFLGHIPPSAHFNILANLGTHPMVAGKGDTFTVPIVEALIIPSWMFVALSPSLPLA